MNIPAIAFGLLFLMNPMRHVIDVLPDCIGCLLILYGLKKPAMLVEKLDAARNLFGKLFLITFLRAVAAAIVQTSTPTFRLVLTFAFSILELIFLLPACKALFEGFVYAGMRFGGESVMRIRRKKGKNGTGYRERVEALRLFSMIFFPVRAALNILPELTALQLPGVENGSVNTLDLSQFYNLIFGICAVIGGAVGIVWAVQMFRYFYAVSRDPVLVPALCRKYEGEILPNRKLRALQTEKPLPALLLLIAVSFVNLFMDGYNLLPGVLPAVFLLLAFLILRAPKVLWTLPILYAGASVVSLVFLRRFLEDYRISAVSHWREAATAYLPVELITGGESILGIACIVALGVLLWRRLQADLRLIGVSPENEGGLSAQDREARRSLRRRVLLAMAGMGLTQLVNGAYVLLAPTVSWAFGICLLALVLSVILTAILTSGMAEYPYAKLQELA